MSKELDPKANHELLPYQPAEWEDSFFDAYLNHYGVIAKASEAAGISRDVVKRRAVDYPAFKEKLATARELVREETKDKIRYENFRRAFEPVVEPIFQRGEYVGDKLVYDNKHLEWLSERVLPEEFHMPTRVEFSGEKEGAVTFKMSLNPGQEQSQDEEDDEPN